MSALYKLTTRCVTEVLRLEVERRGLLAENQLGAARRVQGAKEQALLNIAVNRAHGNGLRVVWIDVKKAFDSIPHDYIERCIGSLALPDWILGFLKTAMARWSLELRAGREYVMDKDVRRGIIQGDSLSPLLFVLCVDPLSRRLNEKHRKVSVELEAESHATNHLLFVDDLKLLAPDTQTLAALTAEAERFFETVGLEINRDKSATNDPDVRAGALLEGPMVYKYLGIIEDAKGRPTSESFAKVKEELLSRVDQLCKRKLNAKNLFKAINEYAITLVDYHIGVQALEPADYVELDTAVRQVLIRHRVHLIPASKERLYLPRKELGRGLHSIEMRSEQMLLQLWDVLENDKISTRRTAIRTVEVRNSTHLSLIKAYLARRYGKEAANLRSLREAQKELWYSENKKRVLHAKLYRARDNEMVDLLGSSTWLRSGNITPRDEGAFSLLQDRNLFWLTGGTCPHCREGSKTVDHLASKCKMMARHEYTRRHNEIVRCLHLLLATRYGFKRSLRIRSHSVQEVMDNQNAEIRVDTRVKTDVRITHNRPDILVYDKHARVITLVEVGVTCLQNLLTVETEKARKYDLLADELAALYKCKVRVIPFVMTWEGVVSKRHCRYARELGVTPNVAAYVQTRVLKRTLETISFEHRRSIEDTGREGAVEEAIRRISAAAEGVPPVARAVLSGAQGSVPDD